MLSLDKVLLALRCRKGDGRASVRVPVTDATLSVDSVSIMQLSATLPTSRRCFTLLSFVSNIPHSSSLGHLFLEVGGLPWLKMFSFTSLVTFQKVV